MDFGKMVNAWIEAFTKPSTFFAKAAPTANLKDGAVQLIIALAIAAVIQIIIVSLFIFILPALAGLGIGAILAFTFGAFILSFIAVGIEYLIARLLGGTGSYGAHYHLVNIVSGGYAIANQVLNIIPIVGFIVSILLGLYSLYPRIIAIKEAHKISTMRAAGVIILEIILLIVIILLIAALFAGSMLATIAAMGRKY